MKSKVGAALFALVFALGFGAGGAFGVVSLFGQLNGWWQARSWQAVPATVLTAELEESHDDSTTYKAVATYRYVVDGRSYEGSRVGFDRGSDNVGSWQRDQYTRLDAARRDGRTIDVWVDPANPTRSVVDRKLRLAMVAFTVPFATLFPMVSIGAFWALMRVLRTAAAEVSAPAKLKPNPREIRSDARIGVWTWWGFAIFWGLIAFPVAFVIVPDLYGRSLMWLVVMIFPAVGLLLIWAAIAQTIRLMRNGEIAIRLNPAQPRLGDTLTVHATFTQTPAAGEYVLTLVCEEVDARGDNTRHRTVWKQERSVHRGGTYATATFSPPANLPASEPSTFLYHRWRLLLGFPDGKDERSFDVTIQPENEGSPARVPERHKTGAVDAAPRPVPEAIATIVDESSRLSIRYAANPNGTALPISLFGLVFTGIGGFLLFGDTPGVGPKVMGFVFAIVGMAVVAAGVYAWTHRRVVGISNGQLHVDDRWLLKRSQRECAIDDVRDVTVRIHGSTSRGTRRYDHHEVKALLRDGREIALGSDIRDAGVAVTLQQLIRKHLAMADDVRETSAGRAPKSMEESVGAAAIARAASVAKASPAMKAVKLAVTAAAGLVMVAMFWDIVEGFIPGREDAETRRAPALEPERPDPLSKADAALFSAVERGGSADEVAKALADGANVRALNGWGATPLLVAARLSSADVVEVLIRAGSDINFSVQQSNEYRGRTPLMNAAHSVRGSNVRLLLEAGAQVEVFESHGWSAAHYAAHHANVEGLRVLREHGANLDIQSPVGRGETPLMIAAREGELDSIRELIKLGADPRAVDRQGENAYGWAKHFKQAEAMNALSAYE